MFVDQCEHHGGFDLITSRNSVDTALNRTYDHLLVDVIIPTLPRALRFDFCKNSVGLSAAHDHQSLSWAVFVEKGECRPSRQRIRQLATRPMGIRAWVGV